MRRRPTSAELLDASPVWCLDLRWGGRLFRLATQPVDLTMPDGSTAAYVDALSDPDVIEETSREGVQEGGSIPLAVYLDGVDVAERIARGHRLERAEGALFMVLADRSGRSLQTWERRYRYLEGSLSQPQHTDPTRPSSWLSFTLEDSGGEDTSLLLDPAATISDLTWPNAPSTSNGKTYPVVIGTPGLFRAPDGALTKTSGSPAYTVTETGGGSAIYLLIAGHEVKAATVRVFDETPSGDTLAVVHQLDGLGRLVATVDLTSSSLTRSHSEFYVCWDGGGGIGSPFGSAALSGLGDVCAWALLSTSLRVDIQRWIAEAGILNRAQIATYINDPTLTPWSLVTRLLEPFLVEIRSGPDGLYPQGRLLDFASAEALRTATEGPDFEPISATTGRSRLADITNRVTVRFALRSRTGDYRRSVTVAADPDPADTESFSDEYAVLSVNRWHVEQSASMELDFIYDDAVAALIAREQVRVRGFGYSDRLYLASPHWGWLMPGDHIRLDSDSLHRSGMICQVLSKRWSGQGWEIRLSFDEDPIRDSSTKKS